MKPNFSVIGKPAPPKDAAQKVSGQMKYTADVKLPHMLYGKMLGSPYARARILHIDTTRAEKLPGVKAVITYRDTTKKKYWIPLIETMLTQKNARKVA